MNLRLINYGISTVLLVFFLGAYGMEQQEIVLSFDLDDVVTKKGDVGLTDFAGLGTSWTVLTNPRLIKVLTPSNFARIRSEADLITNTVNGTSNVVRAALNNLKDQGYGDLMPLESEIVKRATNPILIEDMVAHIKALKEQGYTIIAATNQDYGQHQVYHEKIKETYRVELSDLFELVLTTPVIHQLPKDLGEVPFYQLPSDRTGKIYVTSSAESIKPSAAYFKALRLLAKKINADHASIIHTDNDSKHVDAAHQQEGIAGVHFNIPSGAAHKASDQELQDTIASWHGQISSLLPKSE